MDPSQRPASRRPLPLITAALVTVLGVLFVLLPGPEPLAYHAVKVSAGEVWRLVTAHLVHADPAHLAWNALGLAVLGMLIERQDRALLLAGFGIGMLAVSALLLSPLSSLIQYCGLSGVLNSLLVVALFVEWRKGSRTPVLLVTAASLAKLAWELTQQDSLITQISWSPYPASHAAGMLGGLLVLGFCSGMHRHQRIGSQTHHPAEFLAADCNRSTG
ncbi:MAG: rhombosortase [Pseudomonadota bacterium]